jgi:hypothetical protein
VKPPRETDLIKACLQLLQARGVLAWRTNAGALKIGRRFLRFHSIDGVSDILGCLRDGRFLAVEVKLPGREPTVAQAAFLRAIQMAGGLAALVTDLRQLETILEREGCQDHP